MEKRHKACSEPRERARRSHTVRVRTPDGALLSAGRWDSVSSRQIIHSVSVSPNSTPMTTALGGGQSSGQRSPTRQPATGEAEHGGAGGRPAGHPAGEVARRDPPWKGKTVRRPPPKRSNPARACPAPGGRHCRGGLCQFWGLACAHGRLRVTDFLPIDSWRSGPRKPRNSATSNNDNDHNNSSNNSR